MRKLFKTKFQYYKSIDDLPIWNWFRITEKDDLTYLLHTRRMITAKERQVLEDAFEKIYGEFIDTFGVNDILAQVMQLKRDIAVLMLDMYLTGDRSKQTFIEIKQAELFFLISTTNKENSVRIKAYVDKFMGFYVDEHKISVRDYYSYIELMKEDVKNKERHNGRQN